MVPPQRRLRFSVVSSDRNEYLSADAVSVALTGDNLLVLSYKLGRPNADPESMTVLQRQMLPGPVDAFELALDASGYELTVRFRPEPGQPQEPLADAADLVLAQGPERPIDVRTPAEREELEVGAARLRRHGAWIEHGLAARLRQQHGVDPAQVRGPHWRVNGLA